MTRLSLGTTILLVTLACQPALADTVHARFPREARDQNNVFTRLFPELPPFAPQTDAVRNAVKLIGAKGGLLDAGDNLTDPVQSIINQPVFSPNNLDNPSMTAGMTFFGQLLDHDITLDLRSRLLEKAQPARTVNFRSAAFDLDMVYGDGPERSPELYAQSAGDIKFIVEAIPGAEAVSRKGAKRFDVPRDATGVAIIADSRNDEHVILSQLHLAMLRFHNAVTDHLRAQRANQGASAQQVFRLARRTVQWHYQWCIVNEFLPLTIGRELVDTLLREGPKYFDAEASRTSGQASREREREGFDGRATARGEPMIPIEFSAAAYRFGHSQVRPSYRLNFGPDGGPAFVAFVFNDALDPTAPDPGDLRGGVRAPRRFVDWQTFFDFGDGNFRPNKRIDTRMSSVLMEMPGSRAPLSGLPADGVQSLPSRNLMRHVNFGLPSGQAIARRMNVPPLSVEQLAELAPYRMSESTPLWYYILKEAEIMAQGQHLGPVGARIVGDVFIGLLKADTSSYLATQPKWKPFLPSAGGAGTFRIADLLTFAGVVPPLQ